LTPCEANQQQVQLKQTTFLNMNDLNSSMKLRRIGRLCASVWAFVVAMSLTSVNAFVSQTTFPQYNVVSLSSRSMTSSSSSDSAETTLSSRNAINWIKSESLESLLPKQDALAIIDELLADKSLVDASEESVKENWQKFQEQLQEESRTVAQILGPDTVKRVLKSVETVEGYDPEAVRAFLGSEAVNKLLAKLLYDGITNFFETVDVFGNLIGSLPVIGPIRNQIRDQAKKNVDRTVGPLIQQFLRSYTKVAVTRAADFVLSPANRQVFGQANSRLVSTLLDRPVKSLVPSDELTDQIRVQAYDYFRSVKSEDVGQYVDFTYQLLGDKAVDDVVTNVNEIIDASPTLERTIDRIWTRAIKESEVQE